MAGNGVPNVVANDTNFQTPDNVSFKKDTNGIDSAGLNRKASVIDIFFIGVVHGHRIRDVNNGTAYFS